MTKVIFLDIDGVLSLEPQFDKEEMTTCGVHSYPMDPHCVGILNEIVSVTGAVLVVSSDWRLFYDIHTLRCLFRLNGVSEGPYAVTEDLEINDSFSKKRAKEIRKWMEKNRPDKWVIVDDMNLFAWFRDSEYVRCTDPLKGIAQNGVKEKIIELLSN